VPIYTEKDKPYDELRKYVNNGYVCECGANLTLCWGGTFGYNEYILRCAKDINHTGVSRPFNLSPANTPGFTLYDAGKKRRKELEQRIGERALALRRYQGVITLNRTQATEIMEAIWPGAPIAEKQRAAILCVDYQLNPLMKHIFLVPFNKGTPKESWVTVMGINATRLLAARRGAFSYVDDTPRIMTQDEQVRKFGKSYSDRLYVIVKVKDPKTGAEVNGIGWWPSSQAAYGEEKGNTQFNMAAIRAERQALSRLRPGEMPSDVEVMEDSIAEAASVDGMEETIIEVESTEVKPVTKTESIGQSEETEHWCPIHNTAFFKKGRMKWYAHTYKDETDKDVWCSEGKVMKDMEKSNGESASEPPEASQDGQGGEEASLADKKDSTVFSESHQQESTSKKEPQTLQELLQWASKHGKQYGPSWVAKEANVKSASEITDVAKVQKDIRDLTGWTD
jgi:hypothetical protein